MAAAGSGEDEGDGVKTIKQRFRDWLRGYSEVDIASLEAKAALIGRPGAVVPLTQGEWIALRDRCRDGAIRAQVLLGRMSEGD